MKRLLSILTLFGLLSFPAFAEDFLAKVTNGALSDTSEGVKLLSLEEQKKVVGGYKFVRTSQFDTYGYARSYAYGVTDDWGNATSVSKELGYSSDYIIVAKYRYMNGQKQHYLNYATPNGKTYEFWQYYGNAQKILNEFKARY